MKRGIRWLLWVALGSAMEGDAIKKAAQHRKLEAPSDGMSLPPTLSAFTRWVYQTDTRAGKVAFLASLVGVAMWFGRHIVNGKETL